MLTSKKGEPAKTSTIMDCLTQSSRLAYRELLETEGFVQFYRQATPIDAIERSRIGSRPSRRTGQASLQDLRAIPWVFSWNQSRYYLPGWYGVGAGLEALKTEHPALFDELPKRVHQSAFLRYVFYNAESSLASSDPAWMRAYAGLVEDEKLGSVMLEKILEERNLRSSTSPRCFVVLCKREDRAFGKLCKPGKMPCDFCTGNKFVCSKNFVQRAETNPSGWNACFWWSMPSPVGCAPLDKGFFRNQPSLARNARVLHRQDQALWKC